MPFVEQPHRDPKHWPCCVGDTTYWNYKELVDKFRQERRWTTAFNLTKEWFDLTEEDTQKLMAWMVFFNKEIMKYELEKETENGTI